VFGNLLSSNSWICHYLHCANCRFGRKSLRNFRYERAFALPMELSGLFGLQNPLLFLESTLSLSLICLPKWCQGWNLNSPDLNPDMSVIDFASSNSFSVSEQLALKQEHIKPNENTRKTEMHIHICKSKDSRKVQAIPYMPNSPLSLSLCLHYVLQCTAERMPQKVPKLTPMKPQ